MRINRHFLLFIRLIITAAFLSSSLPYGQALTFSGDPVADFGVGGEAVSPAPGQKIVVGKTLLYLVGNNPEGAESAWVSVFTKTGSLYNLFSEDGLATVSGPGIEWFSDLAEVEQLPEDSLFRVMAVGKTEQSGQEKMLAVNYTHTGSLDPVFGGGDGIVTFDFPGGPDSANTIISRYTSTPFYDTYLGGRCGGKPCLLKLTRSGDLDPNFGEVDPTTGQRSGYRILGEEGSVTTLLFAKYSTDIIAVGGGSRIQAWRMTQSGDPIAWFGDNGCFTFNGLENSQAWAAVQEHNRNGRIYIAGSTSDAGGLEHSFALAITETGKLYLPFGNQGVSDFRLPAQEVGTSDRPGSIFARSGLDILMSIRQTGPTVGEPVSTGYLVRLNSKGGLEYRYTKTLPWITDPRQNFISGNFEFDTTGWSPSDQPVVPPQGYWLGEVNGQAHIRLVEMPKQRDIEDISISQYLFAPGCAVDPHVLPHIRCRTLREAIDYANNDPTGKIFRIQLSGSIDVTGNGANEDGNQSGDLDIYGNIMINGRTGNSTVPSIRGSMDDRVFHVHSGVLILEGLELSGGISGEDGGAIRVESGGVAKVIDSLILQNSVQNGGGQGGAVSSEGLLYAINSTFTQNTADGGGAIFARQGALINVTIAGNTARQQAGGGLSSPSGAALTLQNTIIADNVWSNMNNPIPDDCSGPLSSNGNNLIETYQEPNCLLSGKSAEQLGIDPALGSLGIHRSPSEPRVYNILTGSPALDAGLCTNTPLFDQNQSYRPLDGDSDTLPGCDIGAFELNNAPQLNWSPMVHVPEDNQTQVIDVSVTDPYDSAFAYPTAYLGVGGLTMGTASLAYDLLLVPGPVRMVYFPLPDISGSEQILVQVRDSAMEDYLPLEVIIDPVNDAPIASPLGKYRVYDAVGGEYSVRGYPYHELTQPYNGTLVPHADTLTGQDQAAARIDLPFEFPFFGSMYSQIFISSNGYLTFAEAETTKTVNPRLAILPVNQDLFYSSYDSNIFYKYFPGDQPEKDHWVVTFKSMSLSLPFPSGYLSTDGRTGYVETYNVRYSYDVALYRDGTIVVGYDPIRGPVGKVGLRGQLPGEEVYSRREILAGPQSAGVLFQPQSYSVDAGDSVEISSVDILSHTYDVENQALTLDTTQPMISDQGVVVEVNANGSLVYSPGSTVSGLDSFPYTITETGPGGLSSTGRVFIQVTGLPNSAPTAVNDTLTVDEDTPVTFTAASLLGNDSDPDGDSLTVTQVASTSSQGGSINLSNGVYTYTPPANFNGMDTITYTVEDTHHASAQGTIQVTVNETVDLQATLVREGSGPIPLGEDTVLTFTLTNADLDPATGVQVRGEWSAGLTVNLPSAGCTADGTSAFICSLDDLGPNQSLAFTVRVRASDSAAPGQAQSFALSINGTKKDYQPANNQVSVELTTPAAPPEILTFIPLLVR